MGIDAVCSRISGMVDSYSHDRASEFSPPENPLVFTPVQDFTPSVSQFLANIHISS